jgi:hypothetical protein
MTTKDKRKLVRAIRLIWLSLDSHLDNACETPKLETDGSKLFKRVYGGTRFNRKCVKEYATIIKLLSDIL